MSSLKSILSELSDIGLKRFNSAEEYSQYLNSLKSNLSSNYNSFDSMFESIFSSFKVVDDEAGKFRAVFSDGESLATSTERSKDFTKAFRLGDLRKMTSLFKDFKSENVLMAKFEIPFKGLMSKSFPDSYVEAAASKSLNVENIPKELYSIESNLAQLQFLSENNVRFRQILDNMSTAVKKRGSVIAKGPFVFGTITVASAVAILASLNAAAENAIGCHRFYFEGKKVMRCKIINASCSSKLKDPNPTNLCTLYPSVITPDSCANHENENCVKCDPLAPKSSANYLDPKDFVNQNDYYVCKGRPSVGEVLGQFINDTPGLLEDSVDNVVSSVTGVVKSIWSNFKFIIIAIVVAVIGFLIYYFNRTPNPLSVTTTNTPGRQ